MSGDHHTPPPERAAPSRPTFPFLATLVVTVVGLFLVSLLPDYSAQVFPCAKLYYPGTKEIGILDPNFEMGERVFTNQQAFWLNAVTWISVLVPLSWLLRNRPAGTNFFSCCAVYLVVPPCLWAFFTEVLGYKYFFAAW